MNEVNCTEILQRSLLFWHDEEPLISQIIGDLVKTQTIKKDCKTPRLNT